MSLRKSSSESTGIHTTGDTDTYGDHSMLEDEHTEDDSTSESDDEDDDTQTESDDDDDDDDEETEGDDWEEGYDDADHENDDVSFLVPIGKNRCPNKLARTEKQQEQQRRMVLNLAQSSSGTVTSQDDYDERYHTDDATHTDVGCSTNGTTTDGGGEGYSTAGGYTTGGYSTTTNGGDDRGGGYTTEGGYTTATGTGTVSYATRSEEDTLDDGESTYDDEDENETNRDYPTPGINTLSTGEFGRSGTFSVASQSTATTQPTSPSRKKVLTLTDDNYGDANNLANLAAPDINSRLSLLQSSVTPRTGHGKCIQTSVSVSPQQQMSPRLKERVPGGAAAKLMLLGPRGSKESEESEFIERISSTESSIKINPDATLAAEMERVKEEFSTGNAKLDRSKMIPPSLAVIDSEPNDDKDDQDGSLSLSMKPSFLNRNEIFHQSAAYAVAALLKPRQMSPVQEGVAATAAVTVPFFSSPHSTSARGGILKSSDSVTNNSLTTDPSNPNSVVSAELISAETKEKVEAMEGKMIHPTKTLTDLLTAIATPDGAIPDQLAYAVRRKNACGALLTLTTNAVNRVRICWTAGVLPALKSVLADGLIVNGESTSPLFMDNDRTRAEYDAARNRAISALMNLSIPVKNRIAVFHSPGLIQVILETMDQDHGVARKGCAAILASLAKSSENRLLMAQIPGLIDLARKILKPRPARVEVLSTPPMKEKKSYPWSDDDDASSTSSSLGEHNKIGSTDTGSTTFDDRSPRKNKNRAGLSFVSTTSSFQSYDDSGETPKVEGANSPREVTGYDETADELLQAARQNVFAMLGHLVKEKDNAYHLARHMTLVTTLVEIAHCHESPSHALAVRILANLTRHRLNKVLAFKPKTVVPALIEATQSTNDDARLYACYALQNLSQEKSCRQELAIAEHLIEVLCDRCRNGTLDAERLAAVSTLKNLCDEPANLIPLTNTTGCVTTLMQLAHSPSSIISTSVPTLNETTTTGTASSLPQATGQSSNNNVQQQGVVITDLMQYRACDALATLSHWLRKIATSGYSLDATQKGKVPNKGLFVPSLRELSWNEWT
jgi:hypothetical protein